MSRRRTCEMLLTGKEALNAQYSASVLVIPDTVLISLEASRQHYRDDNSDH